jgi:predicted MFS family arabinose efflux permease
MSGAVGISAFPGGEDVNRTALKAAASPAVPQGVRRSRAAIGSIFAVHGVIAGSYVARLPWIQAHIHASSGVLGAAMVTQTVGALAAMPRAGTIVHRLGAKNGMRVLLSLWTVSLVLPALMPDAVSLAAALLLCGATAGIADVAMNAHGVRIERRAGKSIMSGLHGLWAVGVIAGSAIGGLCAGAGIGAPAEFLVIAALFTVIGAAVCQLLPDDEPADADVRPPRYALPAKAIWGIGAVGFCGVFAEGASDSWSAVYLTHVAHASAAIGAFCVTGFGATMAVGRLGGDAVSTRIGSAATVRAGGLLAAAGAVLISLTHSAALDIAGFAALGLGVSTVVPLAIAATGRLGDNADSAVAGITTITYTAGLLAGPSVGVLGSAVSLPFAFGVVAVVTAGSALFSSALRPDGPG